MDSELDNLKSCWQKLNCSSSADNLFDSPVKRNAGLTSRLTKLTRIFRANIIICLLWIPLSGFIGLQSHLFPQWLVIAMASYFGIMALLSYIVLNRTRDIDPSRLSVVQMLTAVCRLQRTRIIHKTIGFTLCVPLIVSLLFVFFRQNEIMFVGGIVGAILGLVIGLMVDSGIRRQIRLLRSELAPLNNP